VEFGPSNSRRTRAVLVSNSWTGSDSVHSALKGLDDVKSPSYTAPANEDGEFLEQILQHPSEESSLVLSQMDKDGSKWDPVASYTSAVLAEESIAPISLQVATESGDSEAVKTLLKANVDPLLLTKPGVTIWHLAVKLGHAEIVTLLLEMGVDRTYATAMGRRLFIMPRTWHTLRLSASYSVSMQATR
jgi:Ankyrin repeats (3 copies)